MTSISHRHVVHLDSSKLAQASQVLVHAFYSDPIFDYFDVNNQPSRLNSLQWFSGAILSYSQPYSHIYTTSEPMRGIIAWHPPGQPPLDRRIFLRDLPSSSSQIELAKFWEFLSLLFKLEDYRKREMPCLHWYLCILGVIPRYQRQGIGSALLKPVLQQADAEGLPCYVEVATQRAIGFYQHHGFELLGMIKFSKDAPCLWAMKRQPLCCSYLTY
jgi:ribosomal protein S18 acetylase RimI-like enzyme